MNTIYKEKDVLVSSMKDIVVETIGSIFSYTSKKTY